MFRCAPQNGLWGETYYRSSHVKTRIYNFVRTFWRRVKEFPVLSADVIAINSQSYVQTLDKFLNLNLNLKK
jgi:hypothetical protein